MPSARAKYKATRLDSNTSFDDALANVPIDKAGLA